MIIQKVKKKIL